MVAFGFAFVPKLSQRNRHSMLHYPKKYVSYYAKYVRIKKKRQIRLKTSRGVNWKQKNIQVEKVYTFPLLGKILYT